MSPRSATPIVLSLSIPLLLGSPLSGDQGTSPVVVAAGDHPFCFPSKPRMAAIPTGTGFLGAWSDLRVVVGRFDSRGAARGPQVQLGEGSGDPRFTPTPAVAVDQDGRGAVIWVEPLEQRLVAALFEPDGRLLRGDLELATGVSFAPKLAASTEGSFSAVWQQGDGLGFTRFGPDGVEVERQLVSGTPGCRLSDPSVAADGHGGLVVAWVEKCPSASPPSQSVRARRLDRFGVPAGPRIDLEGPEFFTGLGSTAVTVDGQGRIVAAWVRIDVTSHRIVLERRAADGEPLGAPLEVDAVASPEVVLDPTVASDTAGNLVVAWVRSTAFDQIREIYARSYLADGTPVGAPRVLTPAVEDFQGTPDNPLPGPRAGHPVVAVTGPGTAHVVWPTVAPEAQGFPIACSARSGVFALRVPIGGDRTLLLGNGRFRVGVRWQEPFNGGTGVGHAVPDTRDSGGFWFFAPDNTELTVKLLDGRPVNGHFWFFYGALSNVGYRITVTDQLTGLSKTYDNPPGRLGSLADTLAFAAP